MPQKLKLATAQSRTLSTTAETLGALEATTKSAASRGVDVILFPEAYLGGYPRTCGFGSTVGGRSAEGREQFLQYYKAAVDLGDTPRGAGQAWIDRTLETPRDKKYRGDGTREELERIARETGVFIVTGLVERSGGTLYCGAVYVCPNYGILGKRRKLMPTGTERLIWGQGSASTLRAVTTEIKGVRLCMAAAICWENYMPLLRQALYSQNVNLWLAPTADARSAWEGLMRTVGVEGRCFVVSSNQCVRQKHLPEWITGKKAYDEVSNAPTPLTNGVHGVGNASHVDGARARRRSSVIPTEHKGVDICLPIPEDGQGPKASDLNTSAIDDSSRSPLSPNTKDTTRSVAMSSNRDDEFVCRGGSCIISPMGDVLAGPLWEEEDGLLVTEVDFEDCERGRLDLDVAGSYGRLDAFRLDVEGLDLAPPP